jgi:hypothetical protein
MVTFLFTSAILLGFIVIALYYWQKPLAKRTLDSFDLETNALPSSDSRGLFSDSSDGSQAPLIDSPASSDVYRTVLLERAQNGDQESLQAARDQGDKEFYNEVLNSLVEHADSDPQVLALVSFVARHDLPVNRRLAEAVIELWKKTPDRNSTAKTLHIVALSDEVSLYQTVVETALQFWRDGKLSDISPVELRALFDAEFWVLSSGTRKTGAAFMLKRTLAHACGELESAAHVN